MTNESLVAACRCRIQVPAKGRPKHSHAYGAPQLALVLCLLCSSLLECSGMWRKKLTGSTFTGNHKGCQISLQFQSSTLGILGTGGCAVEDPASFEYRLERDKLEIRYRGGHTAVLTYADSSIAASEFSLGIGVDTKAEIVLLSQEAYQRAQERKIADIEARMNPALRRALSGLKSEVLVNGFFSSDLPTELRDAYTKIREDVEAYSAYSRGRLRVSWNDPAEDEAQARRAAEAGVLRVQLNSYTGSVARQTDGFLGLAVLCDDRKAVLPCVDDLRTFEYDITLAIVKVARRDPARIGVISTAETQIHTKYRPLFDTLAESYVVDDVSARDLNGLRDGTRVLIAIGGVGYGDDELAIMDQYLLQGGRVVVLADAVRVSFERGVEGSKQETKVLELLDHYGISVEKKMIVDFHCGKVQVPKRIGAFVMNTTVDYPYFVQVPGSGFNSRIPCMVGSPWDVTMPWASPVVVGARKKSLRVVESLLRSSEKSWVTEEFYLSPDRQWVGQEGPTCRSDLAVHVAGMFSSFFSERTPPQGYTGQLLKSSTHEGHLVVAGDSDFMSHLNATPANIAWLSRIVDWLAQDEDLVAMRLPE